MSDEEELRRWAQQVSDTVPVGETLVDYSEDLEELGLLENE